MTMKLLDIVKGRNYYEFGEQIFEQTGESVMGEKNMALLFAA